MKEYGLFELSKDIQTAMTANGSSCELEDREDTRRFQTDNFTVILDISTTNIIVEVVVPTQSITYLNSILDNSELETISAVLSLVRSFNANFNG